MPALASAGQPDPAYVGRVMLWASILSGLPTADPPPISIGKTARLGPPSISVPATVPLRPKSDNGGTAAITTPWGIFLAADWQQGNAEDDCILRHEMVHWLQFRSGKRFACTAEMERLAYAVQEICLAQRGADFWQVSRWTPVRLAKLMECK